MLLVGRSLVRRGLAPRSTIKFLLATYFLSFPFWFEVHQANLEFVVWIVIIVGLWAFWTDRSYLAAAMFGVAISMKIFPFMYLGLLVARKEFRQAVFALFVTGATTITSLWLVCPDIRYSLQQTNIGSICSAKCMFWAFVPSKRATTLSLLPIQTDAAQATSTTPLSAVFHGLRRRRRDLRFYLFFTGSASSRWSTRYFASAWPRFFCRPHPTTTRCFTCMHRSCCWFLSYWSKP